MPVAIHCMTIGFVNRRLDLLGLLILVVVLYLAAVVLEGLASQEAIGDAQDVVEPYQVESLERSK